MNRVQLFRNRDGKFRDCGFRFLAEIGLANSRGQLCTGTLNSRIWSVAATQFVVLLLLLAVANSAKAQIADSGAQLYFFTSDGCAPCRQVEPEIESLRQAGYHVTTVNLAQAPDWGKTFSVDRTPTVIMVANQRIVGRHAGLIKAGTLKQWFSAVGVEPGQNSQAVETRVAANSESTVNGNGKTDDQNSGIMLATYAELPDSSPKPSNPIPEAKNFSAPATLHAGTPKPANAAEAKAMNATVRLRVRDAEGISYATGTVIHSHAGEWLVMTCGHTFREAGFNGKITAEFNFLNGPLQSADGELISYDSESKDVALVAVHAGQDIEPVRLAHPTSPVDRGLNVFSIGCDGGAEPTIRHSAIKNKAIYAPGDGSAKGSQQSAQGAIKYDIHGRPAIGRSGGGLFNEVGELIGVCNAAAVESDEGIYSALDSLHWQIAASQLSHLFANSGGEESAIEHAGKGVGDRFASLEPSAPSWKNPEPQSFGNDAFRAASPQLPLDMQPLVKQPLGGNQRGGAAELVNLVSNADANGSDTEVIIIVRSKSEPELGESITINNPTPQLIQYLDEMKRGAENRQIDIARARKRTPK